MRAVARRLRCFPKIHCVWLMGQTKMPSAANSVGSNYLHAHGMELSSRGWHPVCKFVKSGISWRAKGGGQMNIKIKIKRFQLLLLAVLMMAPVGTTVTEAVPQDKRAACAEIWSHC